MIYKIFPTQDASIYSSYPDMNTGRDEILEITNYPGGEIFSYPNTSRILIQFSNDEINSIVSTINSQSSRIIVDPMYTASINYSFNILPQNGDILQFIINTTTSSFYFTSSPSASNQCLAYTTGDSGSWLQNVYYPFLTGSVFGTNWTNSIDTASLFVFSEYYSYLDNVSISSSFFIGTGVTTGLQSTSVPDWDVRLKIYASNIQGLSSESVIKAYPVSGAWSMGTGKFLDDNYMTNGVSWMWRDYSGSVRWITSSYAASSTGSFITQSPGGGHWYTSWSTSQSFGYYDDYDVSLDMKNIVSHWNANSMSNNGVIIKLNSEYIDSLNYQPSLKYFSVDTGTIYPPYLEFRWNDYSFNTGSSNNTFITSSNIRISLNNNQGTFISGSINKFRLYNSPLYPTRVYQTSSVYTKNYYLPTSSFYGVKDVFTDEYVIEFSNYTKISADDVSNYFIMSMSGLEAERYYKILVKTNLDGNQYIIDNNFHFKVTNG